jgi:hypothetical protein
VADHHGVCKYDSRQDPNYVAVRNVLKSLVSKLIEKDSKKPDLLDRRLYFDLKSFLAISEPPGIDYIFFRDQWTQGTNNWLLDDDAFVEWRDALEPTHRLLWLSGGAGTGKSVMASFIINSLVEQEHWCQHYFIRYGERKKRTLGLLLRSLAFQITQTVPGILKEVAELRDEGIDFETADPRVIWDRIFRSIVFAQEAQQPLYWVIDGLDEVEDPRAVIKLLMDISASAIPVRILFTGRRTSDITAAFERVPKSVGYGTVSIEGHLDDLRQHIRQELDVSGDDDFKAEIERRITEGSQNSFLVSDYHLKVVLCPMSLIVR